VPGERVEQLDVLLGPVNPFPVVLADPGHFEQPAGLDPGPVVFEFPRPDADRVRRHPLADLLVDLLDLLEERIAPIGEHVLLRPQRQVPAGPQRLPGQHPVTWRQPGQDDQVIEQRLGIVGPDPVVALGCLVERLPQPLALSIGPHRGQYRDPWSGVRPRHSPAEQPAAHLGAVP
jgi:hypothetical protein